MTERTQDELADLLALFRVPGLGAVKFRALVGRLGSPAAVLRAPLEELASVPGVSPQVAYSVTQASRDGVVSKQCERVEQHGATVLACTDADFPSHLAELDDAPPVLFVLGDAGVLSRPGVALVGTRKPTEYGTRVTEMLASVLAEHGVTVVSGMARGVDNAAHTAALKAGGTTVAVLGCGADVVYPRESRVLHQDIQASGAVVSEFSMGTRPDAQNFPRRNRVISGLCRAVVVTEAPIRSGALITARVAVEQNREVFAVPGMITNSRAEGVNRLIADGANVVTNLEEFVRAIGLVRAGSAGPVVSEHTASLGLPVPIPEDVDETERTVLERLSGDPQHIDGLAAALEMNVIDLSSHLTMLEMRGLVVSHSGSRYSRATIGA